MSRTANSVLFVVALAALWGVWIASPPLPVDSGFIVFILVTPVALASAVFFAGRAGLWGGGPSRRSSLLRPTSGPTPPLYARLLTALVAGFFIVFRLVDATLSSPDGTLLMNPNDMPPGLDTAYVTGIVIAGMAAFMTLSAALGGRARGALLILLFTGPCYTELPYSLFPAPDIHQIWAAQTSRVSYAFTVEPPVAQAELWVNGVNLGPLPVTMTGLELEEEVPPWEARTDEQAEEARWFTFERPVHVPDGYGEVHPWSEPPETPHYAAVRLGDEWGESYRASVTRGDEEDYQTTLHVSFPEHEQCVMALLEGARQSDYTVDDAWLKKLDAFDSQAWRLLRQETVREPALNDVFDAWTRWRYDLDAVDDSRTAWRVFERICTEADETGGYDTMSVAGHAVMLLAPRVDPARLTKLATRYLRREHSISVEWKRVGGHLHFHSPARNQYEFDRLAYDEARRGDKSAGSLNDYGWSPPFPASAFVVADAIRHAVPHLREHDPDAVGRLEAKVTRSLLCWWSHEDLAMQAAVFLNGPDLPKFLERKGWEKRFGSEGRAD